MSRSLMGPDSSNGILRLQASIASGYGLLQPARAREAAGPGPTAAPLLAGDEDSDLQQQSAACRSDLGLSRPAAHAGERASIFGQEVFVEIHETSAARTFFVITSTVSYPGQRPPEGAAGRARCAEAGSARRVTAVIPYYGYAGRTASRGPVRRSRASGRQPDHDRGRRPCAERWDLHAGQIQGFFGHPPLDNLYAEPVLVKDIHEHHAGADLVIVSPDVGGVYRARQIARRLDADLAIIDKRRETRRRCRRS